MGVTIPVLIKRFSLGLLVLATFEIYRDEAKADEILTTGLTNDCFETVTQCYRTKSFAGELGASVKSEAGEEVGVDFDESINQAGPLFTFDDLRCEPNSLPARWVKHATCHKGTFHLQINNVSTKSEHLAAAGNDSFVSRLTSIPEPATLMLLGSGLCGIAALGRRRRETNLMN